MAGALVFFPGTPPFPFEKLDIDTAHSEIGFSIRFMGLTNVHGRFKTFRGTVMYVEHDLPRSTVGVLIDVKSVDTGNDWRDRDLKGPAFFNADSFPTITTVPAGMPGNPAVYAQPNPPQLYSG